jgi:hypothetical protein
MWDRTLKFKAVVAVVISLLLVFICLRIGDAVVNSNIESHLNKIGSNRQSTSQNIKHEMGEPTRVISGSDYLAKAMPDISVSFNPDPPPIKCSRVFEYNLTPTIVLFFLDPDDRVIDIYVGKT